jgi:hypothetical protein
MSSSHGSAVAVDAAVMGVLISISVDGKERLLAAVVVGSSFVGVTIPLDTDRPLHSSNTTLRIKQFLPPRTDARHILLFLEISITSFVCIATVGLADRLHPIQHCDHLGRSPIYEYRFRLDPIDAGRNIDAAYTHTINRTVAQR